MTFGFRLISAALVGGLSVATVQGPTHPQSPSSTAYHPTVANCDHQVASEAPIGHPPIPIPVQTRISYTCEKCKNREPQVAETVAQLGKIEASACFRNFLIAQDPFDESHGSSNEQIAADVSGSPVKVTFKFHWAISSACGGLNDDPTHTIDTKNSCWSSYNAPAKAAYIGHEISHEIGYTHYCTIRKWNNRAGNEMTIPYAGETAIEACYPEVIEGKASTAPVKIQRTQ